MNPLYEGCTIISYQNILQCIAMKLNSFLRKALELCFVLYTCHNHDAYQSNVIQAQCQSRMCYVLSPPF